MGGPRKPVELTRDELNAIRDTEYWAGFDLGIDQARRELREEIRAELEIELADPQCETCQMRRRIPELEEQIARLEDELRQKKAAARGYAIRERNE